jgi:hypothetical protein
VLVGAKQRVDMSRKTKTRGVRREAVDRKRKPAEVDVTRAGGESAISLVLK